MTMRNKKISALVLALAGCAAALPVNADESLRRICSAGKGNI